MASVVHLLDSNDIHVALTQETNLHPTSYTNAANHLQIPDDWALAIPSSAVTATNVGKGVSIMVNPSLHPPQPGTTPKPLMTVTHEAVTPAFEVLAGRVAGVTCASVYMHCSTTSSSGHLQPFTTPDIEGLIAAIQAIPNFHSPSMNLVVGGDFNFPAHRPRLEDAMASIGLQPVYDPQDPIPTRRGVPLDLMFWKGPDLRPASVRTVINPTSDHEVLVVDFEGVDVASAFPPEEPQPPLPDWSKLPFLTTRQGEEARARFIAEAREALEDACKAPDPITAMGKALVQVAVNQLGARKWRRQHRLPWWNKGLTKLHRKLRQAKARASAPSASAADKERSKNALKAFQAAVQTSRRRQLSKLRFGYKRGDLNLAWVMTGRHRGKKSARYLKNAVANPERMTAFWEVYFTDTSSPRPEAAIPDSEQEDVFSEFDVNQAILKIQDKTPGADGFRASVLKVVGHDLADLLATGFNNASRQLIDDQAKSSTTIFLKKKGGSATNPADYRPVALQPVMTKLLEKMIEHKLWQQVDKEEVNLSDEQGGFRPHRSRFDLIFLVRCIQDHYHPRGRSRSSKRRQSPARHLFAAFLDIKKAYDSVPHIKIVEVLRRLGVREELVRLVVDLLTNRYTTIYGKKVGVTKGVPQGSPLSPLLFILTMMQPLSVRMRQHGGGGALLPGGLVFKEGFYADDVMLMAETAEELQDMLRVCERWAAEVGLEFNVPKCKLMVLTGPRLKQRLPELVLNGQSLRWVQEFKYLGFPIYAYNNTPKQLPVDLSILNDVLYPLAPTLLPRGINDFFLANRVDILTTMVEGKVLHNSPMADTCFKDMDGRMNVWLGKVAGLPIHTTSATFLRCELGVLPSQLVAERNALYYLWHLRNETWFKDCLPSLQHLPPLSRLTGVLLDNNITLEEFHEYDNRENWHEVVKNAVLERAKSWYNTSTHTERLPNFEFIYRGRPYLREEYLAELAHVAIEARADRLPGVPSAWDYNPCPFCECASGMNGAHLLQCESLPLTLKETRDAMRGPLSVRAFTMKVLLCEPGELVKRALPFARKVFQAARRAVQGPLPPSSPQSDVAGEEFTT